MGKIWLTSDPHFNHRNILTYEAATRPFSNLSDMNETIVNNWNARVAQEDTVYVLGDFFMGSHDEIIPILKRLNGKIILIRGNHDTNPRIEIYKENGIEVKDIEYLRYKGRFFIMCHFPNSSEEFIQMITHDNSEVIWCYGHVHGNAKKGYVDGTYHVGMDTNNLAPISIEQIWQESWPQEMMTPAVEQYKEAHDKNDLCTICSSRRNCFIAAYGNPQHECDYFVE
jgi:calcineurin-like phosphoesterase family protein